MRNRIGLLVETHSWKNYKTRVQATHDTLDELVELAAKNGRTWVKAAHAADAWAAESAPGSKWTLSYEPSPKSRQIDFLGYAYKIQHSDISGGDKIVYDPSHKEIWNVPFFDDLQPKASVTLPTGGYIVEPAHAEWMAKKLQLHGIRYRVIKKGLGNTELEAFRCEDAKFGDKSYEGHQTLRVQGEWKKEKREIAPGSLYVPMGQAHASVIALLLEPMSEDSLLDWGFFNSSFEHKEYMENYVTEDVAAEMLKDPAVRSEFEAKLKDDAFKKSPEQRLEFFYHKHPSWDERFGLYPVYRVSSSVTIH